MDISIKIDQTRLNVRVAVMAKIDNEYIFEYDKNGYYFPIGGRIKINETSHDAAIREIYEEIQYKLNGHKLVGTIENFFEGDGEKFHEICFVYKADIKSNHKLPKGFHRLSIDEIKKHDIRPKIILDMIIYENDMVNHYIVDNIIAQQGDAPAPASPAR